MSKSFCCSLSTAEIDAALAAAGWAPSDGPVVVVGHSFGGAVALAYALRDLRIANVFMRHGDGFEGWPPYAPYDGILVAAAAMAVPRALLEQLGK